MAATPAMAAAVGGPRAPVQQGEVVLCVGDRPIFRHNLQPEDANGAWAAPHDLLDSVWQFNGFERIVDQFSGLVVEQMGGRYSLPAGVYSVEGAQIGVNQLLETAEVVDADAGAFDEDIFSGVDGVESELPERTPDMFDATRGGGVDRGPADKVDRETLEQMSEDELRFLVARLQAQKRETEPVAVAQQ